MADAEAIMRAARQPEIRFMTPKTIAQQVRVILSQGRERLVRQRSDPVNALRSVLCEDGHVFPVELVHFKRIEASVCTLPKRVMTQCEDLLKQVAGKTERITARTKDLENVPTDEGRAFSPDHARKVRRQRWQSKPLHRTWARSNAAGTSQPGWARPGRLSRACQTDIRRLLTIGAKPRVTGRAGGNISAESWPGRLFIRKLEILAGFALARKMARQIRAM